MGPAELVELLAAGSVSVGLDGLVALVERYWRVILGGLKGR
jgi:hypothetical protein